MSDVTGAITNVATSRAQNGAESSRLQYASQMLTNTSNNLSAANSRIADVDVAKESAPTSPSTTCSSRPARR